MLRFWRRAKRLTVASPPADAPEIAHDAFSAIQILQEHGWAKGKFLDEVSGGYCAVAAARKAVTGSHRISDLAAAGLGARYRRLARELYLIVNPGATLSHTASLGMTGWEGRIEGFNDAKGRKKEEVIALFAQVIEKYRPTAPVAAKQDDHELAGGPSV
jgi:hypothetical protein